MYRMYGMPQGARDGGAAMSGCTVCRKEPGMAVRLCQDGRYAVRSQGRRYGYVYADDIQLKT